MEKITAENAKIPENPYKYYENLGYKIDPKLGLVYKDKDAISKQRNLAFTLIKQAGSNIFSGKSVTDVTFPLEIYEPITSLERLSRLFLYAPKMLENISEIIDPLEKFKKIISWNIASLHIGISQKKPMNSYLGETLRLKIGECTFYGEQRKNDTPTALFIGKDFYIYGEHKIVPHTYPNSAKINTEGDKMIVICEKSGKKIMYKTSNAEVSLSGLMMGKRIFKFQGDLHFEDLTNNLYGIIKFNYGEKGFFSGMFSKKEQRDDYFKGFITKNKELLSKIDEKHIFNNKDILSVCEGNWLDFVKFDGKIYWKLGENEFAKIEKCEEKLLLPSDISYRKDICAFKAKDFKNTEIYREKYEKDEKYDKKLREEYKK